MQGYFGGLAAFAVWVGIADLTALSCLNTTRPLYYTAVSITAELQQIFGAVLWVQEEITGSLVFSSISVA